MFASWLPSLFNRQRNRSDEVTTESDRPTKKSTSSKKSSSSRVDEEEMMIERWTIACLNSVVLPPKQELSGVSAPLPLLALFCIIWMAATDDVRKHMKAVCGIDKKSLAEFSATLFSIIPSINESSILIYRTLTTSDQNDAVEDQFSKKLEKRFGRRALICVDRDKQREYIRTNTKRLISDLVVPSSAGLLGFAAAAVEERWQADTRPYADRPFALNQNEKQMHECFEWRGVLKMRGDARVDSCLLPFRDSSLSLVILRPSERSGVVRLRREMTAKYLHTTLRKLADQTPMASRVLLPRVDLHSRAPSLLPKWRLSGVMAERVRFRKKGGEKVCPQFREIAHGASIRIDEKGVHTAVDERRPRSSSASSSIHSYYSAAIDQSIDPNFNLRIDSPFLFFVVHTETMAPILAGTYAGNALITPYTRSLTTSKAPTKSLVRKSVDALSRPLKKARGKSSISSKSSKFSKGKSPKSKIKNCDSKKSKRRDHSPCSYCDQVKKSSKILKKMSPNQILAKSTAPESVPVPSVVPKSVPVSSVIPESVPVSSVVPSSAPSATPAVVPAAMTPPATPNSFRAATKVAVSSTREGLVRTTSVSREAARTAKEGIVKAASVGGEKMANGFNRKKETTVRIATKGKENMKRTKEKVKEKTKSIGKVFSGLSRSGCLSRTGEKSKEESESSKRTFKGSDKATASESSSRKSKISSRPTASTHSKQQSTNDPSSVTRSTRSSSRKSTTKTATAAAKSPSSVTVKPSAKSAAKPAQNPMKEASKSTESSVESAKATAKSTGKEVARNIKKGLSKSKGSMTKFFGRVKKKFEDK